MPAAERPAVHLPTVKPLRYFVALRNIPDAEATMLAIEDAGGRTVRVHTRIRGDATLGAKNLDDEIGETVDHERLAAESRR